MLNLRQFICCTWMCVCWCGMRQVMPTWSCLVNMSLGTFACFLCMLYITERNQTSPKGILGVSCRSSCYLEQTSLPNTLPQENLVLYRKCSENGSFITWRYVSNKIIIPYTRVSDCLSVCLSAWNSPVSQTFTVLYRTRRFIIAFTTAHC